MKPRIYISSANIKKAYTELFGRADQSATYYAFTEYEQDDNRPKPPEFSVKRKRATHGYYNTYGDVIDCPLCWIESYDAKPTPEPKPPDLCIVCNGTRLVVDRDIRDSEVLVECTNCEKPTPDAKDELEYLRNWQRENRAHTAAIELQLKEAGKTIRNLEEENKVLRDGLSEAYQVTNDVNVDAIIEECQAKADAIRGGK